MIDKYLQYIQEIKIQLNNELKKIVKSKEQNIDGKVGWCTIGSEVGVIDRIEYHNKLKNLTPNFIYFSTFGFKNSWEIRNLLPPDELDSSLMFFYNTKTKKISQMILKYEDGSGYTQGFKWKPKDINYVNLNTFIPFMKKICHKGTKKSFWK